MPGTSGWSNKCIGLVARKVTWKCKRRKQDRKFKTPWGNNLWLPLLTVSFVIYSLGFIILFLCMCLSECVPCVQAPWGGKKKKKLSDLLELELLVVVSWWAGNWIWILTAEPSFSFGFAAAAFAGNRISLYRPQWPETYCAAQAGFKFTAIRPPCWDHRCKLPNLVTIVSLNFILKYSPNCRGGQKTTCRS